MKKIVITVLMILSISFSVFGEQTVTDMLGRKVKVPDTVNRVVCRGPGMLRVVAYLNAIDKVAALESGFEKKSFAGRPYIIANPKLDKLPLVGAAGPVPKINLEVMLKVNPDVIILSSSDIKTADNLETKLGIPVIALSSYVTTTSFSDEGLMKSLRIVGKILDKSDRAEEVISYITDIETDLKNRTKMIPDSKKPTVYAGAIGYKGTQGITSTNAGYAAFKMLGAKNVVDEIKKEGHMFIDKEQLLIWNPDFIFVDCGGIDKVTADYQKNTEFYNALDSFNSNKVYTLFPYNFYSTNFGTALANTYYIGKTIYPKEFEDIDPEKKADEIYEFLLGTPVMYQMKKDWNGFENIDFNKRNI